ncbi:MAG: adenine phosphoribosyltransferase [Planctomycetes bacterium]|nr:adenine phosphoribosyltransferase [Planctomycetota bacterium]
MARKPDLARFIRDIPDFPKPGILFKDITPLLKDPAALQGAAEAMAAPWRGNGVDVVAGAEARGFIFAPMIANLLGAGFIPIRKPGKLPSETHAVRYQLEYGSDALEIHRDAIRPGASVLLVDDLLATGGTMSACCALVEQLGGKVAGCSFLIELSFLNGRRSLAPRPVRSILTYDKG